MPFISIFVFFIAIELLSNAINKNDNINYGILVKEIEVKQTLLVDDASFFVFYQNTYLTLISTSDSFSKISG